MGHEAIVYGRINGATWHVGDGFRRMYDLNRDALAAVPEEDNHPWVVRGIFALPAPYPQGFYRRQIIHFGLSLRDFPDEQDRWDVWLGKFERVLRGLYWWKATAHFETDFGPPRVIEWVPTDAAMGRLYGDPPQPVSEWVRTG